MSTNVRTEISKKSPYHLSKHRMLELKHFCLQYPEWKKEHERIEVLRSYFPFGLPSESSHSDMTGDLGTKAADLMLKMNLVDRLCQQYGGDICDWLFMGVAYGMSFPQMEARGIPCSRDYYYERYRRFYWALDRAKRS